MAVLNTKLKRTIGMTFTYKQFLSEFLNELANSNVLASLLQPGEVVEIKRLARDFDICDPSMGFSAKQLAYDVCGNSINGLKASAQLSAEDENDLDFKLLSVERYVGIEGEYDFNFQVAMFNLAESLSRVVGEVTAIPSIVLGSIATFILVDPGTGYDDFNGDSFTLVSTEPSDGSVPATITADASGGEVENLLLVDGGSGFYEGQTLTVEPATGDYTTPALVQVTGVE